MRLMNSFYNVVSSETKDNGQSLCFHIALNREHSIYQAHFPGMPITPGVCIIQMAREILEQYSGKSLVINSIKTAKFLNIVNPQETPELLMKSVLNGYNVDGTDSMSAKIEVEWGGVTFAKLTFELMVVGAALCNPK